MIVALIWRNLHTKNPCNAWYSTTGTLNTGRYMPMDVFRMLQGTCGYHLVTLRARFELFEQAGLPIYKIYSWPLYMYTYTHAHCGSLCYPVYAIYIYDSTAGAQQTLPNKQARDGGGGGSVVQYQNADDSATDGGRTEKASMSLQNVVQAKHAA